MMLFRPVTQDDADQIEVLANKAGTGLTTLPKDKTKIIEKIELSQASFAAHVNEPGNEYYLFVLEDLETNEVVGTSALAAAVGLEQPFYTYKVGTTVHASPRFGIHKTIPTLILGHDYTGTTEICTLFLSPDHRGGGTGKLLSKGRFLFLAQHPTRFADKVIAEMRGYSDEQGHSPFWESLGRHFFDMDFDHADTLSGEQSNEFIAELMPKYPIYVPMLSKEAQAVIGKVHPDTEPALELLKKEGFRYRGYVDIFDAGPTIETRPEGIDTIKKMFSAKITNIGEVSSEQSYLIANHSVANYRCILDAAIIGNGEVTLSETAAEHLGVSMGDQVSLSPLS
ncbi:arginine N-succinyltransferase [Pleionea litopenaei]|uniref:Arginine N-succinyltransferase n=1 Tax=Pleionea litopenaei TaxID=3070815 RepID=A0AA51X7L7_9GAMM|nr:arginine N-succinyltransferase [Pleionea sp. HL-JVS1]WMS88462.1 arginine N-succinyltransferase [Pleionea sp. HL-JVS1]